MSTVSDTFAAKYRDHVDSEFAAVLLEGFQPSELSLRILNEICERVGTDNALIVGGALTAEYAKQKLGVENAKPGDIDIHINLHDTRASRLRDDDYEAIYDAAYDIAQSEAFNQTSGVNIKYIGKSRDTKRAYGSVSFKFEGHKVDVSITQDPLSLETRAMYGDAIIKSIAANKDGDVMAHPYFEEDMENGDYTIRVTGGYDQVRAEERYYGRADYLKDFELVMTEDYAAQI